MLSYMAEVDEQIEFSVEIVMSWVLVRLLIMMYISTTTQCFVQNRKAAKTYGSGRKCCHKAASTKPNADTSILPMPVLTYSDIAINGHNDMPSDQ